MAIANWKLTNADFYKSVANWFDAGRLTVWAVVKEVCTALGLFSEVTRLSNAQKAIDGFAQFRFLNLHGTCVPTLYLPEQALEFINRKE